LDGREWGREKEPVGMGSRGVPPDFRGEVWGTAGEVNSSKNSKIIGRWEILLCRRWSNGLSIGLLLIAFNDGKCKEGTLISYKLSLWPFCAAAQKVKVNRLKINISTQPG
jgi:hypothetical protein